MGPIVKREDLPFSLNIGVFNLMETTTASIIVVNFNGESCLEQCISSVLKTKYQSFEVILFDNGSTDRSLTTAEAKFGNDKRLKIIRSEKNLGFGSGNNEGFKHTAGKYIIFLNNDTIVDPDWLVTLVDTMEKDSTVGLAQSILFEIDGKKIQRHGAGWIVDSYLVFREALGTSEDGEALPDVFEASFVQGAAMLIRRDLIDAIGLFDPKFPFFYDDLLLSFKTWLAGKRVVIVSKSKVCHRGGATFKRSGWSPYHYFNQVFRGLIALNIDLHISLSDLLKALFVFTLSEVIRDFASIKSGRVNIVFISAYTSASFWILRNLRYIWRRRLEIWSRAKITPEMLVGRFAKLKIPVHLYFLSASYREKEIKSCRDSLLKQKYIL
jgi:GT2 family glycosyltransferase